MMNGRLSLGVGGLLGALLLLGANLAQAQVTLLHEFVGGSSDGAGPYYTTPTVDGSKLYGMTYDGGDLDAGTVFAMNTDGTGYGLLHEFSFDGSDGHGPRGSLTLSGSNLYGMTRYGGDSNEGTVFKMNTDGTGFGLLHEFAGEGSDGRSPYGDLTLDGSTLYGMTYQGGDLDRGTVFKMNTDGSGFSLLHEFAGGVSDGNNPYGSLTLSGSTLYGMTQYGGGSGLGTVFAMNTDGTGFGLLHEFAGGVSDGLLPYGSLTLNGSTLYGMTAAGGGSGYGKGSVFAMNTDGTGFGLLHEFAGAVSDGSYPEGSLTLSGSKLYGMTLSGGASDKGTVFSYAIIPEPSTFALIAMGALALLRRRRE